MESQIDPALGSSTSGIVATLVSAEWPTKIVFSLATITVISVLRTIIVNRYFSPISHFPGPFWASVTRLYLVYYHLKGVELEKMKEWHAKYGTCLFHEPIVFSVKIKERILSGLRSNLPRHTNSPDRR